MHTFVFMCSYVFEVIKQNCECEKLIKMNSCFGSMHLLCFVSFLVMQRNHHFGPLLTILDGIYFSKDNQLPNPTEKYSNSMENIFFLNVAILAKVLPVNYELHF